MNKYAVPGRASEALTLAQSSFEYACPVSSVVFPREYQTIEDVPVSVFPAPHSCPLTHE